LFVDRFVILHVAQQLQAVDAANAVLPRIIGFAAATAFDPRELALHRLQFLLGKLEIGIAVGGKSAHGADLHFLRCIPSADRCPRPALRYSSPLRLY
jgi:hypothetical protein